MQEKISAEELQQLRENAKQEHLLHQKIMQMISAGVILTEVQQMEVVTRNKKSEVMALLKCNVPIVESVQLYIYDDKNHLPEAKDYMIKNIQLEPAVEKKIFDDRLAIYWDAEEGNNCYPPRFSPAGEQYMVKETLAKCLQCDHITDELLFLHNYLQKYQLSPVADNALVSFLAVSASENVMEALKRLVMDYIIRYEQLSYIAELSMVKAGNHEVIMLYIKRSKQIITSNAVIEALEERANRDEIVAFYERYANED